VGVKPGPWDENWEVIQEDLGGRTGQGETHLVRRRIEPPTMGVLKILRSWKKEQPRLRMRAEVSNLAIMADAGGNVPQVLDSNVDFAFSDRSQRLFVVMSFIEGRTLRESISQELMDIDGALDIAKQLCETLRIGHSVNIFHRDLKPDNIIVHPEGAVFTLDYGISFNAAHDDEVTQTEETFKNEFRILPEMCTGDRRDNRSDVTDAGLIAYYCLTGKTIGALRDGDDRPPHRRRGGSIGDFVKHDNRVGPLESLFDRAFAAAKENRFQSAEELANELDLVASRAREVPVDLAELAVTIKEELRNYDRSTLLAELGKRAWKMYQHIAQHIAAQNRSMKRALGGEEIIIKPTQQREAKLPGGYDRLGVPELKVDFSFRLHPYCKTLYYAFGARGNRCFLLRRSTMKLEAKGTEKVSSELAEVVSFTRDEPLPLDLVKEDVDAELTHGMKAIRDEIKRKNVT